MARTALIHGGERLVEPVVAALVKQPARASLAMAARSFGLGEPDQGFALCADRLNSFGAPAAIGSPSAIVSRVGQVMLRATDDTS